MGMKSAGSRFAPRWSVRTKALGQELERTVRFDIDRIVRERSRNLKLRVRRRELTFTTLRSSWTTCAGCRRGERPQ